MQKQYFGRRIVVSDGEVQVWLKSAGGNWTLTFGGNRYKEEYGPYAT